MLTDANFQMRALPATDGQSASQKTYGTITNSRAHRRKRPGGIAPPPSIVQTAKPDVKAAVSKPASTASPASTKEEQKEAKAPATTKQTATKKPVPPLKRGTSSGGIMQAFAKGASAKPKKKQDSQPAAPSPAGDSSMALSDDGEDDSELVPRAKAAAAGEESGRKSRKEREEQLRRMMDDNSEEDDEKPDTPMEEAPEPQEEAPVPVPNEEPAEVVSASSGDGRRRGKRRVMRKKQVMDDQGYLGQLANADRRSATVTLTLEYSDDTGARLGVLLGRRAGAVWEVGPDALVCGVTVI